MIFALQTRFTNRAEAVPEGANDEVPEEEWMGMKRTSVAFTAYGRRDTMVTNVLRAHESEFAGNILNTRGCVCVASWPGVYAKLW